MNKNVTFCALFLLLPGLVLAQIIEIPDANFKDALVNQMVVDTDGDGIFDADADTNNDGEIDVLEALAVEALGVVGKNIFSLDGIAEFQNLQQLVASYNYLEEIDLSTLTQLELLIVSFNELDSLDVSQNTQLRRLEFDFNNISSIDLSNNQLLERLWLTFNSISSLDLSLQTGLQNLNADSNDLQAIDLSANPELTYLAMDNNMLTSIDLSGNALLEFVDVYANQLTELDLSTQANLSILTCLNNNLSYLNIQNGNNQQLSFFNTQNNPNLSCIQVDDPTYASNQTDWLVDAGVDYSEDCLLLGVGDTNQVGFGLSPNPTAGIVGVQYDGWFTDRLNWTVLNAAGKVVYRFDGRPDRLDLSGRQAGIYFIRANDQKGHSYVQKLVVR